MGGEDVAGPGAEAVVVLGTVAMVQLLGTVAMV